MFTKIISLTMILALICLSHGLFAAGQEETAGDAGDSDVIEAKLASEEIEGDFMTVWAEKFADYMRENTDEKIDITVYPYGSLGDTRDINELAQLGVVEFVFSDYAWISSFVPQVQVLALHYLWPREKMPETLQWVLKNGKFMPLIEEKFRENDLVPLGIVYEGWQWMTSKAEVKGMDDLQGMKTRLMGSKILIEDFRAYGMSPTPMSYGEVYGALQTGLIDAQVNPLFADHSMKFYEVTDYFTQFWAEPFLGIPTANAAFFDSLTREQQDHMKKFWADAVIPSAQWIDDVNARAKAAIMADKPSIEFHEFDDETIAEFKAAAETVYPKYVEMGGSDAQLVLDTLLKDIADAKAALGIK